MNNPSTGSYYQVSFYMWDEVIGCLQIIHHTSKILMLTNLMSLSWPILTIWMIEDSPFNSKLSQDASFCMTPHVKWFHCYCLSSLHFLKAIICDDLPFLKLRIIYITKKPFTNTETLNCISRSSVWISFKIELST